MKFLSIFFFVIFLGVSGCQRSSGVGDDSDTIDTVSETEFQSDSHSDALDTGDDSSTNDTNPSTAQDSEADTASESETGTESETSGEDTGADTTPLPEPVENEWVFIEGGRFEMGYDGGLQTTKPVHTVSVPSFEIQKTEVTVHQYRQCVDAGACDSPHVEGEGVSRCESQWNENNWLQPLRLNYPVNCIDYYQAGEFCAWLGGRLPTEAEWEYAARSGGLDVQYPWGDTYPTCDLVAGWGGLDDNQDCWSFAQPVCSKPMGNTQLGLCDMAGNYGEWVADRVDAYYGYESAPTDGSAEIDEDMDVAIVRGGNYQQAGGSYSVYSRDAQEITSDKAVYETVRCVKEIE